ncbi:hypothetical protein [Thalassotalea aquiviva]|uniref:hypothetical protein n=1 Tax=Thalassotalea aquiviva TaxID=3242415 RepID=UPI00352B726B
MNTYLTLSKGLIILLLLLLLLPGCSTVTIDQVKFRPSELKSGESIVVLGRRTNGDYETEPELVSCVGDTLGKGENAINVIPEQEFIDRLYPWFEPRTAPSNVKDLQRLLQYQGVSKVFDELNVHYIVWIDGNTEKVKSYGRITCGLSATLVSCFGFGTWDDKAQYEAAIWDYRKKEQIGKISSQADGTSYMPALVVPIPLLAQVQSDACSAMSKQLQTFF